jgi:hypothetical protein
VGGAGDPETDRRVKSSRPGWAAKCDPASKTKTRQTKGWSRSHHVGVLGKPVVIMVTCLLPPSGSTHLAGLDVGARRCNLEAVLVTEGLAA